VLPPELPALGTAICTAISGMLSAELAGRVGVLTLTRWQVLAATALMAALAAATGGWTALAPRHVAYLAASGIFGISIASTALIAAIFSLGPRAAALVFSLYAPMTALLGYLVLGEMLAPGRVLGIGLVVFGVVLAVLFGGAATSHPRPGGREASLGGIAFGLLSALGQAAGTLAARPAMADHVDPIAAMAVRTLSAAVVLAPLSLLPLRGAWRRTPFSWRAFGIATLAASIGTGLGMSLLMQALVRGNVGIVATLAATTPVVILPMVWARSGRPPPSRAWAGAVLAVTGTALIFGL
jgi:drug/metabolite transporter (DMT)-like permease